MRAPGAQGQPGDMTEVDQSGVEGTLSPPQPPPSVICRLEKQRQDSTERAAAFIFFSNPPSPLFWEWKTDPALNGSVPSPSFSAVFKVPNMQLDLSTG